MNRLRTLIGVLGVTLLVTLVGASAPHVPLVDNGLALTPPMGWNSWNHFSCHINESIVRETADSMAADGMRDAGYKYVVIDDCWQVSRDANGTIVADPVKFPHGIAALAAYVHSKGLKFGIYTDAGTKTCQGRPGTYGHEEQDARTYASWGVDYVKEDWCNATGLDAPTQYAKFRDALAHSGRPIVFSICEWGHNQPWNWAPETGNLWRTTEDIEDKWSTMLTNLDISAQHSKIAHPGAWNDPDMLEVGNGGMTDAEYRAHFSLWAIMAAPLMSGNDVRSMSAATKEILLNPEVIAVDQDSLGAQGVITWEPAPTLQVWSKPLRGGAIAVALLNRSDTAAKIPANFWRAGLHVDSANVRDLWLHRDLGRFKGEYATTVQPHSVVMVRVTR